MPVFTAIATGVGMAMSAVSAFIGGGIGAFCMGESEEAYEPLYLAENGEEDQE